MKQASKVTAAVEIVDAVRSALGRATSERQETGWDGEALSFEMARVLGLVFRNEDQTPAQLEELITVLRKVYAGLTPTHAMTVEQAIGFFCPEQASAQDGGSGKDSPVVH